MGLLMERSAEAVVAMLAVLKTGPPICRSMGGFLRRVLTSCSPTPPRWW
ncbi:linear gramicidin synthetase subunit D domain protein [Mycobacterium xenopi 3993]|nr:linear gramicidin synthetase subunit D domain protein [Mycobacterium xenopi 3993]